MLLVRCDVNGLSRLRASCAHHLQCMDNSFIVEFAYYAQSMMRLSLSPADHVSYQLLALAFSPQHLLLAVLRRGGLVNCCCSDVACRYMCSLVPRIPLHGGEKQSW